MFGTGCLEYRISEGVLVVSYEKKDSFRIIRSIVKNSMWTCVDRNIWLNAKMNSIQSSHVFRPSNYISVYFCVTGYSVPNIHRNIGREQFCHHGHFLPTTSGRIKYAPIHSIPRSSLENIFSVSFQFFFHQPTVNTTFNSYRLNVL